MSGSPFTPAPRTTNDLSQAAFPAVPSFTPAEGHAPSRPPARHDFRRPAPHAPSLVSHLELGPIDSSVTTARNHAQVVLMEWEFHDENFVEATKLLVSELTTNAVLASQVLKQLLPSPVHLWLKAGFQRVMITVWDGNPQPPVLQEDAPADAEHGRGLMLVDFFAEQWGWFEPERIGGKCTWCEVTRESVARMEP
jgi:anti-sigma regulatory factor (Ser/Thr protein kinase)